MQLETVVHFVAQCVTSYRWLPKLDTRRVKVPRATNMCGSVGKVRELHGALEIGNTRGEHY